MATNRYTVILQETDGKRYQLCRVLLTSDGSYFVTCPYHRSEKVFLTRMRINYKNLSKRNHEPPVEYSIVDDDDHRIKLSHHPDGFVQFSGHGLISGRNEDGTPKGLGLMSWPLARPTAGPACAITIQKPTAFKEAGGSSRGDVLFQAANLYRTDFDNGVVIEMYYFPATWRRFIRDSANGPVIWLKHPSGAVLELRVCASPPDNWKVGFLGVDLWPCPVQLGAESGFLICSPAGKLSYNIDKELEGEAIYASFPVVKRDIPAPRLHLMFKPRNDPPYVKGEPPPSAD